jgi:hypothetical protein
LRFEADARTGCVLVADADTESHCSLIEEDAHDSKATLRADETLDHDR